MKKGIAGVLALVLFALWGCAHRSMDSIIANEPCILGIVQETNADVILIENENGAYWVSLNVENGDSMTHFSVGDEVAVYYDGSIAKGDPMQIHTVYAVTLRTPAERTREDRP